MLSYAPPARLVAALAGSAVALVIVSLLLDWPGRILALAGAVLLGAEAVHDAVIRPTLFAGASGLVIRHGRTRRHVAWSEIDVIRAHEARRLFVLQSLEIDLDDELIALPAMRLGADPAKVAQELEAVRSVDSSGR